MTPLFSANFNALSRDIDRGDHREYWLKGGRGSGKSTFIALQIVLGIVEHAGANAVIYRKVAATLRDSVYDQIIRAINRLGVAPFFEYRLSPLEIRYKPTGQRILFRGADDPGKSKSITLREGYFGYLWFEELTDFKNVEEIRTIRASVIRGAAERRTVTFCSYNPPKSAQSWVNAEALAPAEGRLVHSSDYRQLPPEWLGEDFIADAEALKATNEAAYRHMYLGEITGTGGQVFDNLQLREITPEEEKALDVVYNGLDFGFAVDPDAYTRWAWAAKTRTLYALNEFYGAHNSLDTLAGKVGGYAGRSIVRCDSADPRMISELKTRGVNAIGVKKGPGSREHGFRWLQELGAIVIDPKRTPNIAREFSGYEYRKDKNDNFLSEYPDGNDHTIDSARYALEPEIGKKKIKTLSKGLLGI